MVSLLGRFRDGALLLSMWRVELEADVLRMRAARWIVRWRARWLDAAYQAYSDEMWRFERFFAWGGNKIEKIVFPLARWLDKEAMETQMVEEGWWG